MHSELPSLNIDNELGELRDVGDQFWGKIKRHNPRQLIGGLWSTMMLSLMTKFDDDGDGIEGVL